jgi:general secretion pathway protein H
MISPAHSQPGFTLLEMIVVLAVLALIAGLVLARGPPHSTTMELRSAGATVARIMRGARAAAIAADEQIGVDIDLARHSIRVGTTAPVLLPFTVGLAATAASGVQLGPRYAEIRFAPDGSSTGGSVALTEGASRMMIVVDWLTGRVREADAH